jgi:hypothetical protein
LTLLALIIGFSFSMAVTRYDQRKNTEQEANAIGTEYVRADLLSPVDAASAFAAEKPTAVLRTDLAGTLGSFPSPGTVRFLPQLAPEPDIQRG